LIWSAIPLGVMAAFVALVFWLWRRVIGFGPVFPAPSLNRRSFAEHITAHGAFIWRVKLQVELLEQLRGDVLHHLEKRLSGLDSLEETKQLELMDGLCGFDKNRLRELFFTPHTQLSRKDFISIVNNLKNIKDTL